MSLVWGGTKMVKNRQVWLLAVGSVVDSIFGIFKCTCVFFGFIWSRRCKSGKTCCEVFLRTLSCRLRLPIATSQNIAVPDQPCADHYKASHLRGFILAYHSVICGFGFINRFSDYRLFLWITMVSHKWSLTAASYVALVYKLVQY